MKDSKVSNFYFLLKSHLKIGIFLEFLAFRWMGAAFVNRGSFSWSKIKMLRLKWCSFVQICHYKSYLWIYLLLTLTGGTFHWLNSELLSHVILIFHVGRWENQYKNSISCSGMLLIIHYFIDFIGILFCLNFLLPFGGFCFIVNLRSSLMPSPLSVKRGIWGWISQFLFPK